MWVFDATPLIYLAKADALAHLAALDGPRVVPERGYTEVVEIGIEQGYPDARRVERGVEQDLFEVVRVAETAVVSRLQRNPNLSDADVAVLGHADTADGIAVIDETHGRDVADTEEITTRGTAYVILLLASRGAISIDTARGVIDEMIEAGWYCAPKMYARIVRRLEEIETA